MNFHDLSGARTAVFLARIETLLSSRDTDRSGLLAPHRGYANCRNSGHYGDQHGVPVSSLAPTGRVIEEEARQIPERMICARCR
jgi:hypothetical protein